MVVSSSSGSSSSSTTTRPNSVYYIYSIRGGLLGKRDAPLPLEKTLRDVD